MIWFPAHNVHHATREKSLIIFKAHTVKYINSNPHNAAGLIPYYEDVYSWQNNGGRRRAVHVNCSLTRGSKHQRFPRAAVFTFTGLRISPVRFRLLSTNMAFLVLLLLLFVCLSLFFFSFLFFSLVNEVFYLCGHFSHPMLPACTILLSKAWIFYFPCLWGINKHRLYGWLKQGLKGLHSTENYCQFSAIAHMYTHPSLVSFIRIPVCFVNLGLVIVVSLSKKNVHADIRRLR